MFKRRRGLMVERSLLVEPMVVKRRCGARANARRAGVTAANQSLRGRF